MRLRVFQLSVWGDILSMSYALAASPSLFSFLTSQASSRASKCSWVLMRCLRLPNIFCNWTKRFKTDPEKKSISSKEWSEDYERATGGSIGNFLQATGIINKQLHLELLPDHCSHILSRIVTLCRIKLSHLYIIPNHGEFAYRVNAIGNAKRNTCPYHTW